MGGFEGLNPGHSLVLKHRFADCSGIQMFYKGTSINRVKPPDIQRSDRGDEIEALLATSGHNSRIHARAYRNAPLTDAQKALNTEKSSVREPESSMCLDTCRRALAGC